MSSGPTQRYSVPASVGALVAARQASRSGRSSLMARSVHPFFHDSKALVATMGVHPERIKHRMPGKLLIKTHGCQMNEYDSAKMADVLAAGHGLELTDNEAEADVILVNTCSIRERAQEKVFSQLGRWKQLKKDKPHLLIGVGGCVASQEGEAIVK